MNRDARGRPIVAGQQTFVATIPASEGAALIWIADGWSSRPNRIKGHDLAYWGDPLHFAKDGKIEPIENVGEWKLNSELGREKFAT